MAAGYSRECVEQQRVAFSVRDARGREIGCEYVIDQIVWEDDAGDARASYLVQAHEIRDGLAYGRRPRRFYFATLAEARGHVGRYVEAQRKAAMKKTGGAT